MEKNKKIPDAKTFWENPYVWLFLAVTFLFGILFIRFILGDYAYFYKDIGSDTFYINYPLYSMFMDVFQGQGFDSYSLNAGLGMDMSSYLFQYLNPLNLMVVLLPRQLLPWSILLATYLKLLLIAVFGYKLFEKWIGHRTGSFTAAILWTFSGYVMLWGQHYGFCTSIMMFTVFLYLVHLYTEKKERSRNAILVLWITLMLFTNYYFLYMSGILGAAYILFYMILKKERPADVIKKLAGLAGMGILGICIGGVCMIPTWNIFRNSTRTGEIGVSAGNFKPYSLCWLLAFLGRLFSNNLMGIGNDFLIVSNYSEMAMISTGSLCFIGVPWLLMKKETAKPARFLTVLSVIMLILPVTGRILTMNSYTQRWSFIICFMEAAAVGFFVKYLSTEYDKKLAQRSVFSGIGFTVAAFVILILFQDAEGYELVPVYMVIFAVFLLIYAGIVLAVGKYPSVKRKLAFLLAGVVCVEMAVINYPTINFRKNPTRHQVATENYNDGVREAYERLKSEDSSLYRMAKDYPSGCQNDGIAQGYPGFSVYLSTNSRELISLKEMYGGKGSGSNSVIFDLDNILMCALLGMKYQVAHPDYTQAGVFTPVFEEAGKAVYEYTEALPFGYLYDSVWAKDEIKKMSVTERTRAALHGFYFTDEENESDTSYGSPAQTESESLSIIRQETTDLQCRTEDTEKGMVISDMGEDSNVIWENLGDVFSKSAFYTIQITMDVDEIVDMALYYKASEDSVFNRYQMYTFQVSPDDGVFTAIIPGGITDLRLDVSSDVKEVTVKDFVVSRNDGDDAACEKLKASRVTDTSFADNTYQASVENPDQETKMLCVPLIYNEGWSAYVDGDQVPLYNINSGLCGVEIPFGNHQVVLKYRIPHEKAGIAMTAAGIAVYLLIFIPAGVRRRKKKNIA